MTYKRNDNTFAGRIYAACQFLGWSQAASVAGVTENRLRQLSNPVRTDAAVLETLFKLDLACQGSGGGAPINDLWQERLGNRAPPNVQLMAAVRVAIVALKTLVTSLERGLCPVFCLTQAVRGG